MTGLDEAVLSLADFFLLDSNNPLTPTEDFVDWRRRGSWATSLYEQSVLDGPVPRTSLLIADQPQPVINLASYNYLGLAKNPEVIAAATAALDHYGVGACGSPILSGMTDLHRELERQLSAFLGREATMLFNSGFGGALGTLAGLLRRGDTVVLDSKCHVSLVEGAKVSGAKVLLFDHNDPDSLDARLSGRDDQRRIVVTEGVFSMDGDLADLPAILPVAEAHGVGVVIDEAHSILTHGDHGRGVTEHFGVSDRIGLQYATMSKAFGAIGGFVSGAAETVDYLRLYASTYGFSCALPPAIVAAALTSLRLASRDALARDRLKENADYFRGQLNALGLDTGQSASQVIPIIIGGDRRLLYELGLELRDHGLFIAVVDYPSVPEDQVRFRASITSAHTRQDLDEALSIISDVVVPRLRHRQ